MIIAIWGCGGVGKTTIADALGSVYASKNTVGVIDTCLSHTLASIKRANGAKRISLHLLRKST